MVGHQNQVLPSDLFSDLFRGSVKWPSIWGIKGHNRKAKNLEENEMSHEKKSRGPLLSMKSWLV